MDPLPPYFRRLVRPNSSQQINGGRGKSIWSLPFFATGHHELFYWKSMLNYVCVMIYVYGTMYKVHPVYVTTQFLFISSLLITLPTFDIFDSNLSFQHWIKPLNHNMYHAVTRTIRCVLSFWYFQRMKRKNRLIFGK